MPLLYIFVAFREYVGTKGAGITASLAEETRSTLETLEASTLALLIKLVTNIAEVSIILTTD